jgi:hypothetical protein
MYYAFHPKDEKASDEKGAGMVHYDLGNDSCS